MHRKHVMSRRGRAGLALLAGLLLSTAALAIGPDVSTLDSEPAYRDAVRLIRENRHAEAIPLLLRLDKERPHQPEVLNWLGFSHRKLKDYPTSKRFYDAALAIAPDYRPALEYQGMWFIETGDLPRARANLARLRQLCDGCEELRDLEEALEKAGR